MHFLLTERHLQKQQEFRVFAEHELDSSGAFPLQNLKRAAERGYLGLPLAKEHGGSGEDFLTYILFIEEISRVCASSGVIIAVHTSVGSFPLLYFGSEAQKKRYLTRLGKGEMLGAFALTEAHAGSDAAALTTTARPVKGGYILNGCKLFITSSGEADLYTVFATVDPARGRKGITAFLVEKSFQGLSAGKAEKKMGLHRSQTTELRLEELFVPVENRLGDEGEGFAIAMSLLDGGRIGIAAQGLGIASAALQFSIEQIKAAEAQGKETGQHKAFLVADLGTRLEGARLLTYQAALLKQMERRCSREASMAKINATDLAMDSAVTAIEIGGLAALSDPRPARYFCDAKATQIYEGTNQIQRIVVARELLK